MGVRDPVEGPGPPAVLAECSLLRDTWLEEGGGRRDIYRAPLLSRVKPRPGTKGPFVPGGGFTRDKRGFWAGRENSQPAAHL